MSSSMGALLGLSARGVTAFSTDAIPRITRGDLGLAGVDLAGEVVEAPLGRGQIGILRRRRLVARRLREVVEEPLGRGHVGRAAWLGRGQIDDAMLGRGQIDDLVAAAVARGGQIDDLVATRDGGGQIGDRRLARFRRRQIGDRRHRRRLRHRRPRRGRGGQIGDARHRQIGHRARLAGPARRRQIGDIRGARFRRRQPGLVGRHQLVEIEGAVVWGRRRLMAARGAGRRKIDVGERGPRRRSRGLGSPERTLPLGRRQIGESDRITPAGHRRRSGARGLHRRQGDPRLAADARHELRARHGGFVDRIDCPARGAGRLDSGAHPRPAESYPAPVERATKRPAGGLRAG